MEEPGKCKLQMSRQAKQKKRKEMLGQVSFFFSQQPLHSIH